ncbi:hypothetical protein PYH37_002672 [Sinorhizobium numidicum]|uniref:Uncharacterized protein n=1 Tax=Sinorhizobium numidicum TaxID=680248 RepID=A0ABY8D0V2_9HYPH|nr:ABC transporter substrate binding protein [Sinorhizobium numidicum]WEX77842.1 hypothetical protein PYH37_002672 [Sinorhizobium numidicum]WEX84501.1 hypothetical protein PYH38_003385 [Sinorhizobium numidicum]
MTIPIVFAAVIDPVAVGFAATLERPGGNVTGLTSFDPQLSLLAWRSSAIRQLPTQTGLWNCGELRFKGNLPWQKR